MEENSDDTAAGGEREYKAGCLTSQTHNNAELEESAAKAKCDPMNNLHEAQHPVMSALTLVLIGDSNSIEIGPKNILIDHDEPTKVDQFSSKLYDLCGRHISVINMLGFPNVDKIPLNQEVDAFLLLLPNNVHSGHYKGTMQWLESIFGTAFLSYVITVETRKQGEKCGSALTVLKANSSFSEKRYHTCTRDMMNENEITALLETIDVMVLENKQRYTRLMCDESKDQREDLDNKPDDEERVETGTEEMKTESPAEPKENSDDHPGGESEDKPVPSETKEKVEEMETKSTAETKAKCDLLSEPKQSDDHPGGESEYNPVPSEPKEKDIMEESSDDTAAGGEGEHEADSLTSRTNNNDTLNLEMSGNKDKQSVNISEETDRKKQRQKETETLLSRLHLQDRYPQKLSPADFLQIGLPVKHSHDVSEKDLANTFLQRLMMLDYRARYIPVKQDNPELGSLQSVPMSNSDDTEDSDDLDALFNNDVDFDQPKQSQVHPMDVQMAVFHCSNSFLKLNLITKLSQCQYALPLLVPDPLTRDIECPLWTFRQIIKTWKINEIKANSTTVTMKHMPICKAETSMVSFFRLGSLSVSKSQLMNSLINERHNTFFHRNCPGSTKSCHLIDGMAEIAWYFPAATTDDSFTDCIAFCNLRGDALLLEKQREILTERSSVNVVLVPTLEKSQKSTGVISALYKFQKPLIILVADSDRGAIKMKEGKYKMGLKDRSQSDVSDELKGLIGNMLSGPHTTFKLESVTEVTGIRVDEDDEVCKKGKSAAMDMVGLLQGMDVLKIKGTFLPCQGQLWHKWCRTNKELYHLKGDIEEEKSKKQQELTQIRRDQCKASSSKLMKSFTDSLLSLPSKDKEYYLKWTQILIDSLSTDDLSLILQRYDEKWSEVLDLKKKRDKSDLLKSKQNELEQISNELQSVTFGLEHMFREMGQIYEAHKSQKTRTTSRQNNWSKYPELAADLMISGHPMELMDGDAGHVPLTWISGLLDEVIKKLKDPQDPQKDLRVFVLSVLGVQSSGKSTMLNAMFGLQFAVSAGRCTKGAFMQLVKVSEEIKKDFKFDYILVVDTEGLRAQELAGKATYHHDNELATFVVGLGNMTLINIFGENPAEMQDVLQIIVQAFMRMKKVKLSPSCVFVHQNVTDIAAAERNMDGKRRLQEKLDQMTQLAAKEEVCDVECFSDVIAFDVQKDVKYFAQLWEGSPPMAPPNPGYSKSVQELKTIILSKASQSEGITLKHFKTKIHDLWNALMNEHFVFSFKNTLEIAVYRQLEIQYGNWTWALRSNLLTIENQLHTTIENGKLDKIELNYLSREMSTKYEEIKKEMTIYFKDSRDKEMLVQWQGRFENKIKEFLEDEVKEVKRKLDEVIQQKKACKKLDDEKTEFENKLLQKSKELAHQLRDKATDEKELKKEFDSFWSHWVTELTADTKPIEDIDLEEDKVKILEQLSFECCFINESKSRGDYKRIPIIGNYFQKPSNENKETSKKSWMKRTWQYVQQKTGMTSTTQKAKNVLEHEEQERIRSFINDVEHQSLNAIKTKPVATRGYRSAYLLEVAKNVQNSMTEFESERTYKLTKKFTVDLLLYVFDRAASWLIESHKTYKMNNDAHTYLDSKKDYYYIIFRSFCKGNSSAVVFGELICEKLKVSTVEAVCNKTAIDLAEEMRCNVPAFSGNRMNLEKHVLKSLAEKKDFDGFITYIRQPRTQAETFIKEEVQKYIFTKQKGRALTILKKNVDDIKIRVSKALFTATSEVQEKGGNINMWVKEFSSFLKTDLTLGTICCQNFGDIKEFDFLKEEIENGLTSIMEEMSCISLEKMKEFRLQPDQILIDQLCKCCWVKCPFCAAVCTNTLEDHDPDDHSVPFHRSTAVKGWHKRNTKIMSIEFCTTKVASVRRFYHRESETSIPYKEYRTAGPRYKNWRITPDESKLPYWKWFVCQFQEQLEDHYDLKFEGRGEIPSEWRNYSREDAIESLDEMFKQPEE
ncbi:interferon-induced very large GTPase 1-like isoform X3 [Amphiprion ocellaris]|uniref:interferon-induced very large GTPase 1-like isoform X3 n=1 Tax=Amphiprion ocellaris TaxID=80972 RepID=UPI0024115098|nr:interferon-induced very large GTPase 1-like isoform X3 [Amphiprion ocellaris]